MAALFDLISADFDCIMFISIRWLRYWHRSDHWFVWMGARILFLLGLNQHSSVQITSRLAITRFNRLLFPPNVVQLASYFQALLICLNWFNWFCLSLDEFLGHNQVSFDIQSLPQQLGTGHRARVYRHFTPRLPHKCIAFSSDQLSFFLQGDRRLSSHFS